MSRNIKELLSLAGVTNDAEEKKIAGKKIVIYGAGVNGRWVYERLKERKINVAAFIDDNHFQAVNHISVLAEKEFAETDLCREDTLVILSFYIKNEPILQNIKSKLMMLGIKAENIFHFVELFMNEYFEPDKLNKQSEEIVAAYSLLADERSKDVFYSYIEAIIKHDAALFLQPTECVQYFDEEIAAFRKGYKDSGYFVDCGAYIGDTFESFLAQDWSLNYIGFEPDINNFNLLAQKIENHREDYKPILFPCATSSDNSHVRFSDSNEKSESPGSAITSNGNVTVPSVALDTAIGGIDISFIKMDVEGAEYDSLLGAKMLIERTHPDLAVCTYHNTEDIWRLINIIHTFYPGYHFYLRSYYLYSRETVLYALNK